MTRPATAFTKRLLYWTIYGVLLFALTVLGSEAIASFVVPSYPARDIRPMAVHSSNGGVVYNDWALRDRPRTFERPAGVHFRSILVGDSFLEGPFIRAPLSAFIEQRWSDAGRHGMEAVNFGVSATGPPQYYYRIKDVALALKPDVIVLAVYAGNDFVSVPFTDGLPPLIAELPLPSFLSAIAPRSTWLAVDRLGLSERGRGNKRIEDEFEMLNAWLDLPQAERLKKIVKHLKQHYFPDLPDDTIREILSRGDNHFWTAFQPRPDGRESLAGWLLNNIIGWETGSWRMPRDAAEADRLEGSRMIDETMSWIAAAERLARQNGIKLVVALIPVGTVDPEYVAFWQHWPKYFSASLSADARHRRLAAALKQSGIPFIDLRDDLHGQPGTYRLTDGHWSQRGTEIVADRLARDLTAINGH